MQSHNRRPHTTYSTTNSNRQPPQSHYQSYNANTRKYSSPTQNSSVHLRRRPPYLVILFISILLFLIYGILVLSNLSCLFSSCDSELNTNFTSSFHHPSNDPPLKQTDIIHTLTKWSNPSFATSRLKIYVYQIPSIYNTKLVDLSNHLPGKIRDPHCDTNFYSSEVHFHRYLLQSSVRTLDPEQADYFYLPVYTTCDLITFPPNDVMRVGRNFQKALDYVVHNYPYWNQTNGRDHVYLFAQGFAARLAGDWKRINNGIFLVHNGEFSTLHYTPHKDLTIPPELKSYLNPIWLQSNQSIDQENKRYLAQFGGQVISAKVSDHRGSNYSGGVRQFISARFAKHPQYRITGVRSSTYLADMVQSRFCLAPEGWHPWSPRPYYAVLMGCIPVIISEVQELAFEDIINWDDFAVWIRPKDITKLDRILRSFSNEDLTRRTKHMQRIWPLLWYGKGGLANEAILHTLYFRKYQSVPRRHFSDVDSLTQIDIDRR